MTNQSILFQAASRGFKLSPRLDRIESRPLKVYLPHCTSLLTLAKSVSYSMVTPLEYREGNWRIVFNSNLNILSTQALIEINKPPKTFKDLLLIDYSILDTTLGANLLTQYPSFRDRLITELSLISKGKSRNI